MKTFELSRPTFAFIVATRAALGVGIGLLLSSKFPASRRCARVRQATQIDHQRSRFCVSPEELPRNRPGVGRDDVIALFEELRPQQRPLRPFRTEDAEPSATSGKPVY